LVLLEWNRLVVDPVLNQDSVFLHIFNAEGFARQRGDESRIRLECFNIVE